MKEIKELIADPGIEVVSFDVFDTLLLRPFWHPTDMFIFLDREASEITGTKDVLPFSYYRQEAEKKARNRARLKGNQDVNIKEIYQCLQESDIFSKEEISLLMGKELELESRFCYARESAVRLVRFANDHGKKVIVTSDMYLSSSFINELLRKNGITNIDKIYVSCEVGATKANGGMYDFIAKDLKIAAKKIIHIGDNLKADIKMGRRHGWYTISYFRPVNILENIIPGKNYGYAFKHSYRKNLCPISNSNALEYLGIRCMLAIVANMVFDDPYSIVKQKGDYANNPRLFGTLALGMYCLSQGLWMIEKARRYNPNHVIFFSRDGYLPYKAYSMLSCFSNGNIQSHYARISRKATLPLLLTCDEWLLCAENQLQFANHSPKSLTNLFCSVLKTNAVFNLEKEQGWENAFSSGTAMIVFLKKLKDEYVDSDKLKDYLEGIRRYYSPMLSGKILTYDVGYNLRNEIALKNIFPNIDMVACFTHIAKDLAIIRGKKENIEIESFYPSAPYVSGLVRELFLTENAASCAGYSKSGDPIYEKNDSKQLLVEKAQQYAEEFIEKYISIFLEDALWLPVDYGAACLPMETFLHSPQKCDDKWVKNLTAENATQSGMRYFDWYAYWHKLRTDFWIANHHVGKLGKHIIRFAMLFKVDRKELRDLIRKRISKLIHCYEVTFVKGV